ncbi:MAG: hypothetical protein Kow0080_35810 [Candidatus Promineifilaceae bacterium]
MDLQTIDFYFGFLANTIAIIGIPFTVWRLYVNWQADKQMRQEISIELQCNELNATKILPVKLRRSDFSRAEILGYLGMFKPEHGERFHLSYLSQPKFIRELQRIQNSKKPETLIIPCTPDEFKQYEDSLQEQQG